MITIIIYILFLHWISDFVLQNRWMAENKSKTLISLNAHVITYTFSMVIGLAIIGIWKIPNILAFCFLNMVLHWLTDFTTSKITAYYKSNKNIHAFFSTIGFDQFIHSTCLVLSNEILTNDTSRTLW